ncbi:MAG: hypothetical protein WCJ01_11035 [Ignavibacteria bacterium]
MEGYFSESRFRDLKNSRPACRADEEYQVQKEAAPDSKEIIIIKEEELILKNSERKYKKNDIPEAVVLRSETPDVIVNLPDKRYDNEFRNNSVVEVQSDRLLK